MKNRTHTLVFIGFTLASAVAAGYLAKRYIKARREGIEELLEDRTDA